MNLDFELGNQSETYPLFIPVKNVMWFADIYPDEEDENTGWYIYDEATATYPEWSPNGSDLYYTSLQFVGDDYSFFRFAQGYGSLGALADYSDGSSGWVFIDIYFDGPEGLDPFAGN